MPAPVNLRRSRMMLAVSCPPAPATVLAKIRRNRVTIIDPAVGERSVTIAEVSPHFSGVADVAPLEERQLACLAMIASFLLEIQKRPERE